MGIIDKVNDQLAIDVWDERMVLRPELRKDILEQIKKITMLNNVEGAWIIGSITGYKYNDTSDIDVNIVVHHYDDMMKDRMTLASGKTTYSARHPVNFFVKESLGEPIVWQDAFFGVYDVIADEWVNPPPRKEIYRDPLVEFKMEILIAKKISEDFTRRVDQLKSLLKTLSKLNRMSWALPGLGKYYIKNKRAQIRQKLLRLIEMAHALESDRKFAYRWGWGIPRKSFRNVVYKVLEHGPYGRLFLLLEKVPLEERFGDIVKEADVDDMLRRAVKQYREGKTNIVPSFGEYQALKQRERIININKPIRTRLAVGASTGVVSALALTKKKAPFLTAMRNIGIGALTGTTAAHGISSSLKIKAAKNLVNPRKDIERYNQLTSWPIK